jgi:CRP-like cAMP-binding protein
VEIAKQLFTWYLANYTRYNVIFGSLETVVILVIWVFYVALIFLFCAEIMSSFERRDMLLLEKALLKPHDSLLKVDARLFQKFGRVYKRDEVVFRENDSGCEMFYVLSGRIRLERSDGHVKKTLAEMGPGQYFGEMAALIDVRRTATARALEDSHLAVIDDRTFQSLIGESREAALAMLREFAARLKNSNTTLEEFTHRRTQMLILMQILEHPEDAVDDHIRQISRLTRKEPDQIGEIMRDLSDRGILTGEGDQAPRINHDKMWSMLDSGT